MPYSTIWFALPSWARLAVPPWHSVREASRRPSSLVHGCISVRREISWIHQSCGLSRSVFASLTGSSLALKMQSTARYGFGPMGPLSVRWGGGLLEMPKFRAGSLLGTAGEDAAFPARQVGLRWTNTSSHLEEPWWVSPLWAPWSKLRGCDLRWFNCWTKCPSPRLCSPELELLLHDVHLFREEQIIHNHLSSWIHQQEFLEKLDHSSTMHNVQAYEYPEA